MPNQFIKFYTTDPTDTLVRWNGDGSEDGFAAVTIPQAMQRRVDALGDVAILRRKESKEAKEWTTWTWRQFQADTFAVAKALIALGLQPHQSINILAFNSPEWFFACHGALTVGGLCAGIYITNSADASKYIMNHSRAQYIFVDDMAQLEKVFSVAQHCPHLKKIVMWGPECPTGTAAAKYGASLLSWHDFLALGQGIPDSVLHSRMAAMKPQDACYLSYTSGTTGQPKAVLYSHDSVLYGMHMVLKRGFGAMPEGRRFGIEERSLNYLPLSHIAGSLDIFGPCALPVDTNYTIYFAFPDAMQGSLVTSIKDVRPTFFLGVPRVWEKIENGLRDAIKANPALEKAPGSAVLGAVGLDQVRFGLVGAAPTGDETMKFFEHLGIELMEIYGMTENTAMSHLGVNGERRIGSVGRPVLPGISKLDPVTKEIKIRHRGLMMGYMYNEKATRETFDEDGWLHTGDIGAIDDNAGPDGFYRIVGRIKELIITAGGENIPPVMIEQAIKERTPQLSNVVIVGDKQKMLVALITLKLKPDGLGGFTPELDLDSATVDPSCKTVADAQKSEKWKAKIDAALQAYNESGDCTSRAQSVRKWAILDTDFSPKVELTPTLKLKRNVVHEKYLEEIKKLYGDQYVPLSQVAAPKAKL